MSQRTLDNLVITDASDTNSEVLLRTTLERIIEVAKAGATQTKDQNAAERLAWIMGRARGQLLRRAEMLDALTTARAQGYASGYAAAREDAKTAVEEVMNSNSEWEYLDHFELAIEAISALGATEETEG